MGALQLKETQAVAIALACKTVQRLTADVGDSLGDIRQIFGSLRPDFGLGLMLRGSR